MISDLNAPLVLDTILTAPPGTAWLVHAWVLVFNPAALVSTSQHVQASCLPFTVVVSLVGVGVFRQGKIAAVGPSFEVARDRKLGKDSGWRRKQMKRGYLTAKSTSSPVISDLNAPLVLDTILTAPPGTAWLVHAWVLVFNPAALVSTSQHVQGSCLPFTVMVSLVGAGVLPSGVVLPSAFIGMLMRPFADWPPSPSIRFPPLLRVEAERITANQAVMKLQAEKIRGKLVHGFFASFLL